MNKLIHLYIMSASFFLIWTLLVLFSTIRDISAEKEKTISLAKHEAITTFNKDQAVRLWGAEHGGVYVPISEKTPPNPYLNHIPDRDITSLSGLQLTLMNPAYMIRQIMEDYEKIYGTKGHITSLKVLNPNNKPDDWERKALAAFERSGKKEIFEIDRSGPEAYLRLMRPMVTTKGCLKCHGFQGYKVGDVRGGVGVKLALAPYLLLESKTIRNIIVTHSIFWAIGVVALFVFTFWGTRRVTEQILAQEKLKISNNELKKALKEVKTLRGIIPICALCKKIKNDEGLWNQLEEYIRSKSEAKFTHSYCPDCAQKLMEELE